MEYTLTEHLSFYNLSMLHQDTSKNIALNPSIKVIINKKENNSILFIYDIIFDENSPFFCPSCNEMLMSFTMITLELPNKFSPIKIRLHPNDSYEISDKEQLPEVLGIDYELSLALVDVLVHEVLKQLVECGIMQ